VAVTRRTGAAVGAGGPVVVARGADSGVRPDGGADSGVGQTTEQGENENEWGRSVMLTSTSLPSARDLALDKDFFEFKNTLYRVLITGRVSPD
jgi:hypothetical protein